MITPRYQKVLRRVCAKGGSSGDTYDAAYNARMATIAEEQQDMAREMYDWYLHGSGGSAGHYEKKLVSEGGREWVPGTSRAPDGMSGRDAWEMGYKKTPGYWKETDPVYEDVWVPGTDGEYSYRDMENDKLAYNRAEIAAALGLLPEQTELSRSQIRGEQDQIAYDQAQIAAAMGLLPKQTELTEAQIQTEGDQLALNREKIAAELGLLPEQTALSRSQIGYDQAQIAAAMGLLPQETDLRRSQISTETDQLAYDRERIAAEMGLLPEQTRLSHAQIGDQLANIQERAPVRAEFYRQALTGMDPERMANMAAADAAQSFMNADASSRRSAARTGVGPDSGRFAAMSTANAMNQAKTIGAARTQARVKAENDNFSRLNTAMGYGG